jgi:hypothetical protein
VSFSAQLAGKMFGNVNTWADEWMLLKEAGIDLWCQVGARLRWQAPLIGTLSGLRCARFSWLFVLLGALSTVLGMICNQWVGCAPSCPDPVTIAER